MLLRTYHGADGWSRWPVRTDSDVVVFLAGPSPGPGRDARVALKIAWSAAGAAALAAQRGHLAELHAIVILFARDVPERERCKAEHQRHVTESGVRVLSSLDLEAIPRRPARMIDGDSHRAIRTG